MSTVMAQKTTKPNKVCLAKGCDKATASGERLCVLHYYQLPRSTRQALAIEDDSAQGRDRRLMAFLTGGQPLDKILIV